MTAAREAALIAFAASGTAALYALERGLRSLALVTKPLTTALLLLVVGPPSSTFAGLVWAGLIASVAGDAALLGRGDLWFMVGLGLFLLAHGAYVAAFVSVASWSAATWLGLALVAVASPFLLRVLWPRVGPLRAPVVAYLTALSAMVVTAFATLGGVLPTAGLAAFGAVLFYVSDASLAIDRFVKPIRHAPLLSVGLYWLGQLGIALTAAHSRVP